MTNAFVLKECTNRSTPGSHRTRLRRQALKTVDENNRNILINENNKLSKTKRNSKTRTSKKHKNVKKTLSTELKPQLPIEINVNSEIDDLENSIDKDISMLSIKDDLDDLTYCLPNSFEIDLDTGNNSYLKQLIDRRNHNRKLLINDIDQIKSNIIATSMDAETGERYLIQNLDYLQELEIKSFPLGRGFLCRTNVNPVQRREVVSWLFDISKVTGANRDVIHIAMGFLDRYTKIKGEIDDQKSYMVAAVCCYFMACKVECICQVSLEDICKLINLFDTKTVKNAEFDIIITINSYLTIPSPFIFLRPLSLLSKSQNHEISKYIIDFGLYTYALAGHPAHILAASAFCLSTAMANKHSLEETWSSRMQFLTGLSISDIKPVIDEITAAIVNLKLPHNENLQKEFSSIKRRVLEYLQI